MLKKGEKLIREVENKDYEDLIFLWQKCFDDEREYIESFLTFFRDRMKAFVYEKDSKVVSAVYCLPSELSFEKKKYNSWYLYAVSTLPEYRKRGYAGQIIGHIKENLAKESALFLTPSNEKNHSFYSALGFEDAFYQYIKTYKLKEIDSDIIIKQRENEDIYELRNKILKDENYVVWDSKHIDFAFGEELFLVEKSGEIKGYFHIENEKNEYYVDELCVEADLIEETISKICKMYQINELKVATIKGEDYCKKTKGMIYYKFDSIGEFMSKKGLYLGINIE